MISEQEAYRKELKKINEENRQKQLKDYKKDRKGLAIKPHVALLWFFKRMFDFSGRSTRAEYFWAMLFTNSIMGLLLFLGGPDGAGGAILLLALPSLSLQIRRLHDAGFSWGFLLVGCIPVVGAFLLFYLFCRPSDYDNQWGEDPFISYHKTRNNIHSDEPKKDSDKTPDMTTCPPKINEQSKNIFSISPLVLGITLFFLIFVFVYFLGYIWYAKDTKLVAFNETETKNVESEICYITPSGKKHHSRDCQYIRYNENPIKSTVFEAKKDGLEKCLECIGHDDEKTKIELEVITTEYKEEKYIKHGLCIAWSLLFASSVTIGALLATKRLAIKIL